MNYKNKIFTIKKWVYEIIKELFLKEFRSKKNNS